MFSSPLPTLRTAALAGIALAALGTAAVLSSSAASASGYIELSQYAGAPGTNFTVQGGGFKSNEMVTINFLGQTATATANGGGTFSSPVITVPWSPSGSFAVNASGNMGDGGSTSFYVSGFYPTGGPSSYYVLPNQMLGFMGNNFSPNETVDISWNGSKVSSITTGGNGSFSVSNVVTIPYAAAGSTQSFQLTGRTTGMSVSFQVSVGRFYPNINPSTYYLMPGKTFSVSGTGFAPGETVNLLLNGSQMMQTTADGNGGIGFGSVTAPNSGGSFEVRAVGASSGAWSARTVTLAH